MDVSSSSSGERAGERNQIIDEVRVRRSKGGWESGPYFIADTVHANLFVLDGSSLMFAPSPSFKKLGHHAPFPLFAMKQAWIGHYRNAVWVLISLIIDILPGLFLWLLFTYSPLLFLWFMFTTVKPWSLACCLEEFPSYVIVYFQANYFEIG